MSEARQILPLTGWRGILALWVVIFHSTIGLVFSHFPVEERFTPVISSIILSGFIAVDAFFLLSGFIMCYVYEKSLANSKNISQSLHFYCLRLSRLYPVHLSVLLVYLLLKMNGVIFLVDSGNPLSPLIKNVRFTAPGFIKQIFLISSWAWNPPATWNCPAWSINSEWFMYLLFPLLIPFISRVRKPWLIITGALLSLSIMLLVLWQEGLLYPRSADSDLGLIRVIGCFLCGCFLYQFYRSNLYPRLPWPKIGIGCFLIILLLLTTNYLWLTVPLFAIILLSLTQSKGILAHILATPIMVWLGKISYSLYMTHLLLMELLGLAIKNYSGTQIQQMSTMEALGTVSFLTLLSIGTGAAFYYLIEEPARHRLRIIIDKHFNLS